MINEEIREREVRLIGEDGEQLGVMTTAAALAIAEQRNLDLVNVAPQSKPPVCKIMDYGKYRFEAIKREKEAKKNQHVVELKEVRLSATIDQHDLEVKAKAASRFFADGNKVKVSIRFRGRQATHSEIGRDVMNQFYELLKDECVIDRQPKLEGRNMSMFLSPKTEAKK